MTGGSNRKIDMLGEQKQGFGDGVQETRVQGKMETNIGKMETNMGRGFEIRA